MALKKRITREDLKRKYGDENIFRFYFGEFEIGKSYSSVFRKDTKNSTGFYISEHGSIIYNDLATGDKYDFLAFVSKKFNISFYKALDKIDKDLSDVKLKPFKYNPLKEKVKKEIKTFRVEIRPFTKRDLEYWAKYSITLDDLNNNNIYSVNALTINDYKIYTLFNELKFAYLFKDEKQNGYFKIYSPENDIWRWSSNTPLNLPFGMDKLTCEYDTLVITKSVKDCIVLRKFFPECFATQNESSSSLKKETIKALQKCYKHIYIWFDMDRPGIKAANYFKKKYGFKPLFIGDKNKTIWKNLSIIKKEKIKDPSDFIAKYGYDKLEKYIQNLNINVQKN